MNTTPIPRKLNDDVIHNFYEAVTKVHTIQAAVVLCGVSEHQFYAWMKHAETDITNGLSERESLYIRLQQTIKKARADVQAQMLDVIRSTATEGKNWLPAAWYLERTNPDEFGRRDATRITQDVNVSYKVNMIEEKPGIIEGEYKELT